MNTDINSEIQALEGRLRQDAQRLAELKRSLPPLRVQDYELQTRDGPAQLSEFFFEKEDLIVFHNMGHNCTHCTMWADGFNGVVNHLMDRCGLLLVSPDVAEVVEEFADESNWPALLPEGVDAVIDACDQVRAKTAMAAWARALLSSACLARRACSAACRSLSRSSALFSISRISARAPTWQAPIRALKSPS